MHHAAVLINKVLFQVKYLKSKLKEAKHELQANNTEVSQY